MIARWLAPSALVVVGLAAFAVCSNGSAPPGLGGAGPGGGGPGPAGTGGAVSYIYVATCPAALPADGAACTEADRTCSYGNAPRGECRDRATCAGGHWAVHLGTCAPPSPAADCPSAVPAPQARCARDQQLCAYPDGRECVCFSGAVSKLGWVCDGPRNTGGDCPASPPNAGTACAGAASCTYVCGLLTGSSVLARCVSGAWTWSFTPCAHTNM